MRQEDADGGRVVREELHARRPRADGDDASQQPGPRENDAVELESVTGSAVEEGRVERPARFDGDEPRRERAGRRRRQRAEELEEAPLVLFGVPEAEELAAQLFDLGAQRAVFEAQRAPRGRPGSDVVDPRAHRYHEVDERGHGREEPAFADRPPVGAPHLERQRDEAEGQKHRQEDLGAAFGEGRCGHGVSRG